MAAQPALAEFAANSAIRREQRDSRRKNCGQGKKMLRQSAQKSGRRRKGEIENEEKAKVRAQSGPERDVIMNTATYRHQRLFYTRLLLGRRASGGVELESCPHRTEIKSRRFAVRCNRSEMAAKQRSSVPRAKTSRRRCKKARRVAGNAADPRNGRASAEAWLQLSDGTRSRGRKRHNGAAGRLKIASQRFRTNAAYSRGRKYGVERIQVASRAQKTIESSRHFGAELPKVFEKR